MLSFSSLISSFIIEYSAGRMINLYGSLLLLGIVAMTVGVLHCIFYTYRILQLSIDDMIAKRELFSHLHFMFNNSL
jgi:hypothetical protein